MHIRLQRKPFDSICLCCREEKHYSDNDALIAREKRLHPGLTTSPISLEELLWLMKVLCVPFYKIVCKNCLAKLSADEIVRLVSCDDPAFAGDPWKKYYLGRSKQRVDPAFDVEIWRHDFLSDEEIADVTRKAEDERLWRERRACMWRRERIKGYVKVALLVLWLLVLWWLMKG